MKNKGRNPQEDQLEVFYQIQEVGCQVLIVQIYHKKKISNIYNIFFCLFFLKNMKVNTMYKQFIINILIIKF